MIVAYTDFIAAFPEFSNATTYPQGQFAFWETQAENQLSDTRFGTSLPLAIMLYVAHNIVVSARAAQVPTGAISGDASGVVTSKSVGSVSKSYDTRLTAYEGAGPWNATSYGQRFYQLLKAFAASPIYVPGYPRVARYGRPYGF